MVKPLTWDWKKTAAEARRRLIAAKHGGRESALRAAGGTIDVNTVRRAVAALEFLDRLKSTDPDSYRALEHSSFGVVETFSRWWTINATDAKAGLSKWKKGELTTRGLAASMRKSALPTITTNDGSSPLTYGDHVEPRLRRDIEAILGRPIIRSENRPTFCPRVDFRYSVEDSFDGHDGEVAAIVVGPYQNQTIYKKNMHTWMLKALGLVFFFDWIFVVLPAETASDDYKMWLERARAAIGADPAAYRASVDAVGRVKILVIQ